MRRKIGPKYVFLPDDVSLITPDRSEEERSVAANVLKRGHKFLFSSRIMSVAVMLLLFVTIACSTNGDEQVPATPPPPPTNTPLASSGPIPLITAQTPLPTSTPPNVPSSRPIPLITIETPLPTSIPVPTPTATPEQEASPKPETRNPKPAVTIGDAVFDAEIAHTSAERVRGLSGRANLTPQSGMLFVFPSGSAGAFWMKNMLIPLDFVWIGKDCTVVDVTESVPNPAPGTSDARLPRYSSSASAAFNFEINAGEIESLGLEIGDEVRFARIPSDVQGANC